MRAKGIKSFGCEKHRFQLSPPLSSAALAEFEKRYAVTLPEDFRQFLLQAGNGGGGPYYGIYPVDRWNNEVSSGIVSPDYLAKPCPLHPDMPTCDDWLKKLGCNFDESLQGAIPIAHMGCACLCYLVVSGQAHGRVFYMPEDGPPYFVWNANFLGWYERWLDELLMGYDDFWFGYGLPGREEEVVEAMLHPIASDQSQYEALRTLARIPALSDKSLQAIRGLLDSDSADVRRLAVSLLGKTASQEFVPDISMRLNDLDPSVRQAALSAHEKLGHATLESATRAHSVLGKLSLWSRAFRRFFK